MRSALSALLVFSSLPQQLVLLQKAISAFLPVTGAIATAVPSG